MSELGEINISDEVIIDYVYDVVTSIPGIYSFSGNFSDAFSKSILGKESKAKGIKIAQDDESIDIDIYIVVDYGVVIPDVAWNAQKAVQTQLKKVVTKKIERINVHVQGVRFEDDKNE